MRSTIRTYPLSENPLLRASAIVENKRTRIELRGVLSHLPFVKAAAEMMDGQVPAQADDRLTLSTWFPPVPSRAFSRLVRSYLKASVGMRTPDQVTISITEECPNRCVHCALPDSGRHLRLGPGEVKDLIDQVLDMGTTLVIFDGGEPTTYPELPDLVAHVDDRAASTMFTSGVGFTQDLAQSLKEAGLYAVNISLDSPVEGEHDSMRGRVGTFQKALEAARNALDAELLVDLYVVVRRGNLHQMEDFHRLARSLGVHELTLFEVVPVGRWANKKDEVLSKAEKDHLDEFYRNAPPPRVFSVPSAFGAFGCFAGRNWMHITPAGDVYPCACLPRVVGNVKDEPVKTIWERMAELPYAGSETCPLRQSDQ